MFKPNAVIESIGNWGTGIKISLEDGSWIELHKDVARKDIAVTYHVETVGHVTTNTEAAELATTLFDYLYDLTQ